MLKGRKGWDFASRPLFSLKENSLLMVVPRGLIATDQQRSENPKTQKQKKGGEKE